MNTGILSRAGYSLSNQRLSASKEVLWTWSQGYSVWLLTGAAFAVSAAEVTQRRRTRKYDCMLKDELEGSAAKVSVVYLKARFAVGRTERNVGHSCCCCCWKRVSLAEVQAWSSYCPQMPAVELQHKANSSPQEVARPARRESTFLARPSLFFHVLASHFSLFSRRFFRNPFHVTGSAGHQSQSCAPFLSLSLK